MQDHQVYGDLKAKILVHVVTIRMISWGILCLQAGQAAVPSGGPGQDYYFESVRRQCSSNYPSSSHFKFFHIFVS